VSHEYKDERLLRTFSTSTARRRYLSISALDT